jgi:2'-5' RNA ligase
MGFPGYHLWLKPDGDAYNQLAAVVRDLAQRLNAPVFDPHVTLLGNLIGSEGALRAKTATLAQELRPLTITLSEPGYTDEHFRCLFMAVRPSDVLMETRAAAERTFDHVPAHFQPHVSLLYGSYPLQVKQEVIAELPTLSGMTFEAASISLIRADSDDPKDWQEIERIRMGRSAESGKALR